jgi:hypothetical protein
VIFDEKSQLFSDNISEKNLSNSRKLFPCCNFVYFLNFSNRDNQFERNAISPTRKEDFPEWDQRVIQMADPADHGPLRGCMVIRPWGSAISELVQKPLNETFHATRHPNATFLLLLPLKCFEKEEEYVGGFAKECSIVVHTRLHPHGGSCECRNEKQLCQRSIADILAGKSMKGMKFLLKSEDPWRCSGKIGDEMSDIEGE